MISNLASLQGKNSEVKSSLRVSVCTGRCSPTQRNPLISPVASDGALSNSDSNPGTAQVGVFSSIASHSLAADHSPSSPSPSPPSTPNGGPPYSSQTFEDYLAIFDFLSPTSRPSTKRFPTHSSPLVGTPKRPRPPSVQKYPRSSGPRRNTPREIRA
jgi:hypothetical protein